MERASLGLSGRPASSWIRRQRQAWPALLLAVLVLAPGSPIAPAPAFAKETQLSLRAAPGTATAEEVARKWSAAVALESQVFGAEPLAAAAASDRLARAALLFEWVAEEEGGATHAYWRAARTTWLSGDFLPLDDVAGRVDAFERALALAERGVGANAECAECMLWKFIALGRLRTTRGVWQGVRRVKEMADLLDRAIELNPTTRDSEFNSTLGNLHYSSAIYYRILPDWFWIQWVLGVKGDKERALDHSRRALELHPNRLDYQIEVATQLLCLGSVNDDRARIEEGRKTMRDAIDHGRTMSSDDRREIHFANLMLEEPSKSCGYSGDKLLEMDEDAAKRARQ